MVKKLICRCLVCKRYDGRPFPSQQYQIFRRKELASHLHSVPLELTLLDLCTYAILTVKHVIARCMSVYSPAPQLEVFIQS